MVLLVKPQFEAGRQEATRGRGVIRDPDVWRRAVLDVGSAMESQGATMMGVMVSPLKGADGNVEFLAWLRAPTTGAPTTGAPTTGAPTTGAPTGLAERIGIDGLIDDAVTRRGA
jgi:23S rRNA (cytidine1920-2'-O)/16S rRNA (cytidine1409-2'-O)-methyltransferase